MTNRIAIYAAWDKDGNIDDADIAYLSALKKCVDKIIYIADCDIKENEKIKLKDICCHVEGKRHREYDFGSYKRGFIYAIQHHLLDDADELIFVNDSCFAPFHPFKPIFEKMSSTECDFWGLTLNTEFYPHIQSFFLVFRPLVFNSAVFKNFMQQITTQTNVNNIIQKYEIGLTKYLEENGFNKATYIPYPINQFKRKNLTAYPIWLIKQGFPLLKKKAMNNFEANDEGIIKTYMYVCRYGLVPLKDISFKEILLSFIKPVLRFLYQKKITKKGKLLIKICKIPVFTKVIK